jgi:hypothetical protein
MQWREKSRKNRDIAVSGNPASRPRGHLWRLHGDWIPLKLVPRRPPMCKSGLVARVWLASRALGFDSGFDGTANLTFGIEAFGRCQRRTAADSGLHWREQWLGGYDGAGCPDKENPERHGHWIFLDFIGNFAAVIVPYL